MITRNGFVSNSSSSSFIVIGKNEQIIPKFDYQYIIGENGKYQFGWENEVSTDFNSRVNFCFIQGMLNFNYGSNPTTGTSIWLEMLFKVLEENLKVKVYSKLKNWGNPFNERDVSDYSDFIKLKYKEYLEEHFDKQDGETLEMLAKNHLIEGYIDHQSSVEDDENIEMFENEETLTDFLFRPDSYIETGNDNSDNYYPFG